MDFLTLATPSLAGQPPQAEPLLTLTVLHSPSPQTQPSTPSGPPIATASLGMTMAQPPHPAADPPATPRVQQ